MAKTINPPTMSKKPMGLTKPSKGRVAEVSNVNRTINEMQRKIDQQIAETGMDTGNYESSEKVQNSMLKVLSALSHTVGQIGQTIPRVGKDIVTQYSSAISQDISYNKQNIVGMALSSTTPIFGYFAAKFMETDVFKTATAKMKTNIGQALSGVAGSLKSFFHKDKDKNIKNKRTIYNSAEEGYYKERPKKGKKNRTGETIPKLATGGYIKKSGLANVHAAEVVAPLKTLDKQFSKSLTTVYQKNNKPANDKMLKAVLSVQDTLGSSIGSWQQTWQNMILKHPALRKMTTFFRNFKMMLGAPFKILYQIFKPRGGYKAHLSRASNPLQAINENIGMIYADGMWRLDNIAKFVKATAEATRDLSTGMVGVKYPALEGVSKGTWTIASALKLTPESIIKGVTKFFKKEEFGNRLVELYKEERDFLEKTILAGKIAREKEVDDIYAKSEETLKKEALKEGVDRKMFITHLKELPQKLSEIFEKNKQTPEMKKEHKELMTYFKDASQTAKNKKTKIVEEIQDKQNRENTIKYLRNISDDIKNKKSGIKNTIDEKIDFRRRRKETFKDMKKFEREKKRKELREAKRERYDETFKNFFTRDRLASYKENKARRAEELKEKRIKEGLKKTKKGGIFGIIGSILPFMGMIFSFLFKKVGGGLVSMLKFLIPGVLKGVGKLVYKTLGVIFSPLLNLVKGLATGIMGFFTNPAVLSFLGSAALLAGAAYGGWLLGKKLDDWLGITKKFQEKMNEWDKKASELAGTVTSMQQKSAEKVRKEKGSAEGYLEKRKLSIQARVGIANEKTQENVGAFGRRNLIAIQAGQDEFIISNINKYLSYNQEEIDRARSNWEKEGGSNLTKLPLQSGEEFGKIREKAFFTYLSNHAIKLTDAQLEESKKNYQQQYGLTPTTKEKVGGIIKDSKSIAKEQAEEQTIEGDKITDELRKQGYATLASAEKLKGTMMNGISSATNIVSTSVNNISNVSGGGGLKIPQLSAITKQVMNGGAE